MLARRRGASGVGPARRRDAGVAHDRPADRRQHAAAPRTPTRNQVRSRRLAASRGRGTERSRPARPARCPRARRRADVVVGPVAAGRRGRPRGGRASRPGARLAGAAVCRRRRGRSLARRSSRAARARVGRRRGLDAAPGAGVVGSSGYCDQSGVGSGAGSAPDAAAGSARAASASSPRARRRVSSDRHRRADRHQPREPDDVGVAQADAAVRDAAGDQLGLVGAVDADEAAGRPVGQHGRAGARPERDRAVERAARSGTARRGRRTAPAGVGRAGGADGDRRAEDGSPSRSQRRPQALAVDDEVRVRPCRSRRASRAAPSRSGRSAGPASADPHPDPRAARDRSEHLHDVARALGRQLLDARDGGRVRGGLAASRDGVPDGRPDRRGLVGGERRRRGDRERRLGRVRQRRGGVVERLVVVGGRRRGSGAGVRLDAALASRGARRGPRRRRSRPWRSPPPSGCSPCSAARAPSAPSTSTPAATSATVSRPNRPNGSSSGERRPSARSPSAARPRRTASRRTSGEHLAASRGACRTPSSRALRPPGSGSTRRAAPRPSGSRPRPRARFGESISGGLALVGGRGEVLEGDGGAQERVRVLGGAAEVVERRLARRRAEHLLVGPHVGALDRPDDVERLLRARRGSRRGARPRCRRRPAGTRAERVVEDRHVVGGRGPSGARHGGEGREPQGAARRGAQQGRARAAGRAVVRLLERAVAVVRREQRDDRVCGAHDASPAR